LQNEQASYCFTTTMARGQAVSEAIQWTIIRLSATMPCHEISGYTDISDRKIRDIIAHFKTTGGIKGSKRERPALHKSLQDEDIQVYFNLELLDYANLYYQASFQHS
jgi:hypothetical protein